MSIKKKRIEYVKCKDCARFGKIPHQNRYYSCGYSGARMMKKDGERLIDCPWYINSEIISRATSKYSRITKQTPRRRMLTGKSYVVNQHPSGGFKDVSVYHIYDHTDHVHQGNISHDEYREKVLMRKLKSRVNRPSEERYFDGKAFELINEYTAYPDGSNREIARKISHEWKESDSDALCRIIKIGDLYWVYAGTKW